MTKPHYWVTDRQTDKTHVGHYILYFVKFEISVTTVDTYLYHVSSKLMLSNQNPPKKQLRMAIKYHSDSQFAVYVMNAQRTVL
jgi:hypothetical protein